MLIFFLFLTTGFILFKLWKTLGIVPDIKKDEKKTITLSPYQVSIERFIPITEEEKQTFQEEGTKLITSLFCHSSSSHSFIKFFKKHNKFALPKGKLKETLLLSIENESANKKRGEMLFIIEGSQEKNYKAIGTFEKHAHETWNLIRIERQN